MSGNRDAEQDSSPAVESRSEGNSISTDSTGAAHFATLLTHTANVDVGLQSRQLSKQRRFRFPTDAPPPQPLNELSSRNSSLTGIRVPSLDSSPSRKRTQSSRSKGVHSNAAAPRRIDMSYQSGADNSLTARTVDNKNFGG